MKRILLVLSLAVLCSISNRPPTAAPIGVAAMHLHQSVGTGPIRQVMGASRHRHRKPWWKKTPKAYAHHYVMHHWPGQFWAENEIVTPESGWDPCAVYPGMHACGYYGSNSCGIPQANPCPTSWQGRMFETRWAQVRWLEAYIAGRYGDPVSALAFREAHGWY